MESSPARRERSERQLSRTEVQAVLGRAIELAVGGEDRVEAIPEAELLRIGGELGLPPAHVRRALAEIDGGIGSGTSWLGVRRAGASRVVAREAEAVRRELEAYLLGVECMVVDRRFADRTAYAAGSGVVAWAMRRAQGLLRRHPLLAAERVEVAVQPVERGTCCVAVALDLARKRREAAAIALAGGSVGAGAAAAAGVALVPPAALIGVPIGLASFLGARAAYRRAVADATARVESLLDRLVPGL